MAGALHLIVAVLLVAGAVTGAARTWLSATLTALWVAVAVLIGVSWRKTSRALALSTGMFVVWTAATLLNR